MGLLQRIARVDPECADLLVEFALREWSFEWERVRRALTEIVADVLAEVAAQQLQRAA